MNVSDYIFWNVDTQFDFVSPNGKLYVPGAELLKPKWKKLTQLAKIKSLVIVNTADWHYSDSAELSQNPDFVNSFPPHCMANTSGAEFVQETNPENPLVINWEKESEITKEIIDSQKHQNYVIRKDAFDVFKGNRFTEQLLGMISPKTVIVYGVTTNVCVNDAVLGLAQRVNRVIVVEDAIKELPNIPLPFENWRKLGVELMQLKEIEGLFHN
jgi:nicotinamidase/pyrazinamidase